MQKLFSPQLQTLTSRQTVMKNKKNNASPFQCDISRDSQPFQKKAFPCFFFCNLLTENFGREKVVKKSDYREIKIFINLIVLVIKRTLKS